MTPGQLYGLYAVLVLLAGGVYLAMPAERPAALHRRLSVAGFLVAAGGLVWLGFYLVQWLGAGEEGRVFFAIFSVLAIAAAIRVVTHRRPVYSAVYLVLVVLATTGLCVLAAADFLAAALVIVYGGAILVTYVFVIMLAQQRGDAPYDVYSREPFAAVVLSFALLAATTQAMVSVDPIAEHAAQARELVHDGLSVGRLDRQDAGPTEKRKDRQDAGPTHAVTGPTDAVAGPTDAVAGPTHTVAGPTHSAADRTPAAADRVGTAQAEAKELGNVRMVGRVLMGRYMIAVQLAGILMLVAMAGAIAVARKRIEHEYWTPFEQSQAEPRPRTGGRHVEPFVKVERREHR